MATTVLKVRKPTRITETRITSCISKPGCFGSVCRRNLHPFRNAKNHVGNKPRRTKPCFVFFDEWKNTRKEKITVIDDGTETNETRLGAVRDIRLALTGDQDYLVMAGDNVLDFSLVPFIDYAVSKGTSCVMCHEENDLAKQQRTAIITLDENGKITSYEEKPKAPKGNLAVPPFYYYKANDIERIDEALSDGCGYDAPGSFAAWLSTKVPMHAWRMTGSRHDIGDMASYEAVRDSYKGPKY